MTICDISIRPVFAETAKQSLASLMRIVQEIDLAKVKFIHFDQEPELEAR
jgi:hypothetical protein